jgi:hypothetical protein
LNPTYTTWCIALRFDAGIDSAAQVHSLDVLGISLSALPVDGFAWNPFSDSNVISLTDADHALL